jgi:hypothetical protein
LRKYGRWVDPATLPRSVTGRIGELTQFAGRYRAETSGLELEILIEDSKMFVDFPNARRMVATLADGTLSVLGTSGLQMIAVSSKGGKIESIQLIRDGSPVATLNRID